MRDETIDSWTAAHLWAALARRCSLVVVGGPSGVGKTTLLTALLDFLPPQTRRIYPRGCSETFDFLSDATLVAAETAVLINEISPHLPVYLWGPAVQTMLEGAHRGYTLLATAHAESGEEFVRVLTASPLRIPAPMIAAFQFVTVMERSAGTQSGRFVRGVWRLERTTNGVDLEALPAASNSISRLDQQPALHSGPWFPPEEIRHRQQALNDFRDRHKDQLPVVDVPNFCRAIEREP